MRRFRYHHYYYPRQRTAYGPRPSWRTRQHVHMAEEWAVSVRDLRETVARLTFEALPMPHGGTRLVVYCPACGARRARLYAATSHYLPFVCRRCAGLVYWRQYEGRRLEAADSMGMPERALWAARNGYRGWRDAWEMWKWRTLEHNARADMALVLKQLEWARYLAWCRRLDELNAAVLAGKSYYAAKRKSRHTAEMIRLQQRIRALRRQAQRQHKAA